MFKRLAHVCIGATDLAQAEDFYVNRLGLAKAFDFIRSGQRIGFYVAAGEHTFIEVFAEKDRPHLERRLIKHFCLEVEDLDAARARLIAKGVAVSAKIMGADHSWQAWISDPSGIRIELMQYTAASTQFSGAPVLLD